MRSIVTDRYDEIVARIRFLQVVLMPFTITISFQIFMQVLRELYKSYRANDSVIILEEVGYKNPHHEKWVVVCL